MSAIEQRRLGTVRILGISGSLRTGSLNTKLLRAAAGLVGEGVPAGAVASARGGAAVQ